MSDIVIPERSNADVYSIRPSNNLTVAYIVGRDYAAEGRNLADYFDEMSTPINYTLFCSVKSRVHRLIDVPFVIGFMNIDFSRTFNGAIAKYVKQGHITQVEIKKTNPFYTTMREILAALDNQKRSRSVGINDQLKDVDLLQRIFDFYCQRKK